MVIMLTTFDNPFDPITQWDDWLRFDEDNGYYTCGYLSRIAATSDELSDTDNAIAIDQAIQDICEVNPHTYKRVVDS